MVQFNMGSEKDLIRRLHRLHRLLQAQELTASMEQFVWYKSVAAETGIRFSPNL